MDVPGVIAAQKEWPVEDMYTGRNWLQNVTVHPNATQTAVLTPVRTLHFALGLPSVSVGQLKLSHSCRAV